MAGDSSVPCLIDGIKVSVGELGVSLKKKDLVLFKSSNQQNAVLLSE
jgi:hypothetical protein